MSVINLTVKQQKEILKHITAEIKKSIFQFANVELSNKKESDEILKNIEILRKIKKNLCISIEKQENLKTEMDYKQLFNIYTKLFPKKEVK